MARIRIALILKGMRKACCLLFSFCLLLAANAQRSYFLYFETENAAPFYVKMGEKIYSATSSGYLILPEMGDSIYTVAIGFPSVLVESRFRITVSGNDRGLLIRNPGPSPVLADLQTNALTNPFIEEADKNVTYQQRTDDFTTLLSKAAGDPGLVYVAVRQTPPPVVQTVTPLPVIPDQPLKKDSTFTVVRATDTATLVETITPPPPPPARTPVRDTTATVSLPAKDSSVLVTAPVSKDSTALTAITTAPDQSAVTPPVSTPAVDSTVLTTPKVEEPPYHRSVVKKHAESSTAEGFGLVYYDRSDAGMDTIRLLIPNPRIVFHQPDTVTTEGGMIDKKEITITSAPDTASYKTPSAPVNTCKTMASDADFFKLRKAMAAKVSDEAMVDEAKKSFRSRCFTTEQVKNLGSLFLTSAGKYQFFDAAYPHVSDPAQFSSLSSEIRDDYYLKRFKALVAQ